MSGFKITRGQGFHVTFENGWTVSVQFGAYNYRDGYPHIEREDEPEDGWESGTAEVAAWPEGGDLIAMPEGDTVAGWQTPAQVLALMVDIASRQSAEKGGA